MVSGLGKGVTISSMGKLLQSCGLKVTAIKIDPYLNVDAGTMSPFEQTLSIETPLKEYAAVVALVYNLSVLTRSITDIH